MMWLASIPIVIFASPIFLRNTLLGKYVPLFAIFVGVSSAIGLFRCIWFTMISRKCSWYSAGVAWMFIHAHIICPLCNLSLISTMTTRYRFIQRTQQPFVASFVATLMSKVAEAAGNDNANATAEDVQVDPNHVQLAESLYAALVDYTIRNYALGAGLITYATSEDRRVDKDKEKDKETDFYLQELELAFEHTKAEFALTHVQLEAVVKELLEEQQQQQRLPTATATTTEGTDEGCANPASPPLQQQQQQQQQQDPVLPEGVRDYETLKTCLSRLLGARLA
jgi:hypothetical protein